MSRHLVRYGDSLWKIAGNQLGSPSRWKEIAQLNHIENPNQIFVGQELLMPERQTISTGIECKATEWQMRSETSLSVADHTATHTLMRSFMFVVADEVNPFTKKLTRKVVFPHNIQGDPELIKQILNPDKHGFFPRDPKTNVSVGRHVLGMTNSNYISASEFFLGSELREGKRFWIDVDKLKKSGAEIIDADEIVKDLRRIAAKTKDPERLKYIEEILQKSISEKEVLIKGKVPATAVKSATSMVMTRSLQVVSCGGILLSAWDMKNATVQSYDEGSIKPLARESVHQVSGWSGAFMGARLGVAAGALVGIETGPGAVITAGVGGLIGAVAGFFGAEWINQYLE